MKINKINRSVGKLTFILVVAALVVVGVTYAALELWFSASNGTYSYATTCFDIDYDQGEDITGTLIPSSIPKLGLTGGLSIGFDENCDSSGFGNLYLTINSNNEKTSVLTQTVKPHCEDKTTLETLTGYDSEESCSSQNNGKWVTDGSALKYAVYADGESLPVSVGHINTVGKNFRIYSLFEVFEKKQYDIYIWLDGNLSDETYANIPLSGLISAEVEQKGGNAILLFDANGGSGAPGMQVAEGGSFVISDVVPTRSGYKFLGWSAEPTSIYPSYYLGNKYNFKNDVTLYAVWLPDVTTSYSCTNGSAGSEPYFITYSGDCTIVDDGFDGWKVKFLSTGVLTVSDSIYLDLFVVGGGGAGGAGAGFSNHSSRGGGGGGGGASITVLKFLASTGTTYEITIGAAGANSSFGINSLAYYTALAGSAGGKPVYDYNAGWSSGIGAGGAGRLSGQTDFYGAADVIVNAGGAGGAGGTNSPTAGSNGTYEFNGTTGDRYGAGGGAGGAGVSVSVMGWGAYGASGGITGGGTGARGCSYVDYSHITGASATAGSTNTGSGGGGGGGSCGAGNSSSAGGGSAAAGGSGVLIIRNSRKSS